MLQQHLKFSFLLLGVTTTCVQIVGTNAACAQAVAGTNPAKVGNATMFPLSNYVNNPLSSTDPGAASETRHTRRQSSTGIGGSFLGTESVTSETAQATQPMYAPVLRNPAISQTNSYNYYTSPQISPALRSVTNNSNLFSSGAAPSFEQSNYSSPSNTGLDTLPSFNRNTVIQGYSHGGRSWLGQ
jgi:hypothetical protein